MNYSMAPVRIPYVGPYCGLQRMLVTSSKFNGECHFIEDISYNVINSYLLNKIVMYYNAHTHIHTHARTHAHTHQLI
jgi:hypothetical protein